MKVVVSKNETQGHIINKYKFKVLSLGGGSDAHELDSHLLESSVDTQEQNDENATVEEHTISSSSKDELVESLLKKTDEMSSNFIKLQMKLEEQEAEFKVNLEAAKTEAYEQGVNDAKEKLKEEMDASQNRSIDQFSKSVQALEKSSQEFQSALGRIENELVHAAVDIAKEVIGIELEERSSDIALKLSSDLISDLQGSAKITLKVNPADHGVVSEKVGKLENVDIISDSAISPGGVIATSDSGNIDSEIMNRYERVKRSALGG
jgi:flagellar assembly protein FliH